MQEDPLVVEVLPRGELEVLELVSVVGLVGDVMEVGGGGVRMSKPDSEISVSDSCATVADLVLVDSGYTKPVGVEGTEIQELRGLVIELDPHAESILLYIWNFCRGNLYKN